MDEKKGIGEREIDVWEGREVKGKRKNRNKLQGSA